MWEARKAQEKDRHPRKHNGTGGGDTIGDGELEGAWTNSIAKRPQQEKEMKHNSSTKTRKNKNSGMGGSGWEKNMSEPSNWKRKQIRKKRRGGGK